MTDPQAPQRPKPLTVHPIRTSCVLLEVDGVRVLTDPFFAPTMSGRKVRRKPGIPLDQLPPIDFIVASHLHTDHFDLAAVAQLYATNPDMIVLGTVGTARYCSDIVGLRVLELRPWDELKVREIAVLAIPASHTGPPPAEINFVLDIGPWRVFFGGDARLSAHHDALAGHLAGQAPIDLAMLPVGGSQIWLRKTTMDPDDAVIACTKLQPRYALGIHEGGEWPAMPPLSRHPGRRVDFDALLKASNCVTEPVPCAPGEHFTLSESGWTVNNS